MPSKYSNSRIRTLLARTMFAGSVFLLPVENASADAILTGSSSFISADAARANAYMDTAGTWNGTTEVTNTTGDTLSFTISNTAVGLPVDDSAFDISADIDVGSNFRLPSSPFAVTVTEFPVAPACPVIAGITATQAGGAGTTITLNFPADTDIEPGCAYTFDIGLTADDVAPSVPDGLFDIDFNLRYNVDDDDILSQDSITQTEVVDVRTGDIALLKTAVTASAGDGDLVEFTVSILGSGDGGLFDVVLADTLSSDLTGLIITPPVTPPGAAGPAANEYTFDYIAEGEVVDVTIQATVSVDPNATSCPILLNTADATDRTGATSTFFDAVSFSLTNPFIDYTPPNIVVPFGPAGIDVTIPVTNTGPGVAKNVSISGTNLGNYTIVVDTIASPNWSYAGGTFTYTGTIASGASEDITFNVSANSCPGPGPEDIQWSPLYQNACGTDFLPPLRFSSISAANNPDATVAKTSSSGALNIGETGSYTLQTGGTNIASLPDDGVATNLDFVITDTLPTGVTAASIPVIPAGTEVLVNGGAYTAGNLIPDNAAITWRGDRDDLLATPALTINYTAGAAGVCPVGQTITNTATMDYASCGINNSDSAGFILSESPSGLINNLTLTSVGPFEAGAADTNAVDRDEAREGEWLSFQVDYTFPLGFVGTWAGSSFTADLRASAGTGVPLVLTNGGNDVNLRVTRLSDATVICNLDLNPATDFTGGDGTAALVIPDLDSITGCSLPANMADHEMILTYSATSPEGDLDGNSDPINDDNIGSYLETTTLTVNGGALSCLGNTDFVQAITVDIERADLGLGLTLNNGNPVSVCETIPATINLGGPAADTAADNILLTFNDANFEFVDGAGNVGDENADIAYGGSAAILGFTGARVANDDGNGNGIGDDIILSPASSTGTVTADGSFDFNVRLRNDTLPQTIRATLEFDSNHTSPDGAATDIDRDYSATVNGSPFVVVTAGLEMEFFPPSIILLDSTTYDFAVQVENVGTGTAVDAVYRMQLPAGMRFDSSVPAQATAGPFDFSGQTIEWALGDLPAGQVVDITINLSINQTSCFQATPIVSTNEWGCGLPITESLNNPPLVLPPAQLSLSHDSNNSFCELCNDGEVRLNVSNTGGVLLTEVVVSEDLRSSGLTYVPGSSTYFVDGVAVGAAGDPTLTGANDEILTWTSVEVPELATLYSAFSTAPGTPQEIEIRYNVRRNAAAGFDEEGIVVDDRNIEALATYGLFCDQLAAVPTVFNATSGLFELPIEQPTPAIQIQGRNVDAGQSNTQYTSDVFGGAADDVIWRMRVSNSGGNARADLEDLLLGNDYTFLSSSSGGAALSNFEISEICDTEANATLAANGASPGAPNCISPAGTVFSTSEDIGDPRGNPGNDEPVSFIDVLEGGQADIFIVGSFATRCNRTQNDSDIEWGCQVDNPPAGGITVPGSNNGVTPGVTITDTQLSSTDVDPTGVNVVHTIAGRNAAQPLGATGTMVITVSNNSGGTLRNLVINAALPAGYTLDRSLESAIVTPAFGTNYAGMIDTITLDNPQANDEDNTSPQFSFTSVGVGGNPAPPAAPQNHVLRNGDVLTITLGLVRNQDFDIVADPVERTEVPANDPAYATGLSSSISAVFENTCGFTYPAVTDNITGTINPDPEDLDIDINPSNADLIYIISDPTATLTLDVIVTNNGGHDAEDFFTLVSIGEGLNEVSVPAGCSATSNPPPRAVWIPAVPASSDIYRCTSSNPITPGGSDTFSFVVERNLAATVADLTFRADVIGEITQADGTPLTFPTPDTGTIINTANNYSLDSIRARLIGFNLVKTKLGNCSEDADNIDVQIGEECTYRISAGWFGFATPGFASIQVDNISISDTLPAGQGFVSQDTSTSTVGISNIVTSTTGPAGGPAAVTEYTTIEWTFDPLNSDETFTVDLVTRTMNNALNSSAAPNLHNAVRTDDSNASFTVDFTPIGAISNFDSSTPGYPPASLRQQSVTVIEPGITVTKAVCNENNDGVGPTCADFQSSLDDGDTNDDYIYRIRVANANNRATAFNVEIVDTLDTTGLLTFVTALGIDNDNDQVVDNPLNTSIVGSPEVITMSHTANPDLLSIAAGETVDLYYRVDVDDATAPGQTLDNSAVTSYDTLDGATGSQTVSPGATGTASGARLYTETAQTATIEITNLSAPPDSKGIMVMSHTAIGGATPFVGPQNVSIGEEIEIQLQVDMPVASLNNFTIVDNLPAGLICVEAPPVDLSAGGYVSAGFVPGGAATIVCNDNVVSWDFGNQQLTTGPTFNFTVSFIARVVNTADTDTGDSIINGGGAGVGGTVAELTYDDAGMNPVNIPLGPMTLNVAEPVISLTKSVAPAAADAQDVLDVTVTITNNVSASPPSANAYNLQILDDLDDITVANLTYIPGSEGGANVPDNVDIATLGANRPIFSWNTGAPVYPFQPGDSLTFTYQVSVDDPVEPLEALNSTLEAAWTSLPDNSVSLNAGGSIGTDGDIDGMRIGAIPNVGAPASGNNDFELAITNTDVTVPALTVTKSDVTAGGVVNTIGARRDFQLVITLPEGNTDDLLITDNLNFGGTSYVLENGAGALDVTYSFQNITTINGVAPAEGAFNAFPADQSNGSVVWDIGDIVTDKENDSATNAVNPQITINYRVRIDNNTSTDDSDTMQNEVTLNYTNGETGGTESLTSSTAPVTVLEPDLTATKVVSNITSPGNLPDGGDTMEYVVTVSNTGNSTAFDINIIDTLPAELQLDAGFVPTVTINAVPLTAPPFVPTPSGAPGGPLVWGQANGDGSLDLPAGQDLVLTYRVNLQDIVEPNLSIDNSVLLDWTSLDGVQPEERTGTGCPIVALPNDYCSGPFVATLDVIDANAVTKVITADTDAATAVGTARVGDTVTYELQVDIQEGRTRNISLQDVMPTGMTFVDVLSVNGDAAAPYDPPGAGAGSNFSYTSIPAASLPSAGATGTTTFTLGTITNDPTGDATTDTFVIEYRARITENAGILQAASTNLVNTATLDYIDAAGAAPAADPRLSDTATITLLQPVIASVAKTDRNGLTSGVTVDPGSDVMAFQLEACNSGGAPAYGVEITDDLPTEIDESSIAGPLNGAGAPDVSINGGAATAGVDYTYTAPAVRGGNMLFDFTTALDPGECIDIDFDVGFYTDFAVNMTWDNSVEVDEYWSLPPANAQQYAAVGPTLFSMNNTAGIEAPSKALQTPVSAEATIGEEVVYLVTVPGNPMTGALHNVVVSDTLESSLTYISATEVSGNGYTIDDTGSAGTTVSIQTDLIPAGEQAQIEIRARVDNNINANAGDNFDNTVSYTFATLAGQPSITPGGNGTTATSLLIIEPRLVANVSGSNIGNPGNRPVAGDVIELTTGLGAQGGAILADNFSDVFDVGYDENLSLSVAYIPGSAVVSGAGNTVADPVISGDGVTIPQTLRWSLADLNADIDVAEGTLVTPVLFSFRVRVLDNYQNNQQLSISPLARWTSLDGIDANERDGSGIPAFNDYATVPFGGTDVDIEGVGDGNALAKTRISDTFGAGDDDVRIGDVIDYELRATIQRGTSPDVVITDSLPQGLQFESIVSINGDTTADYDPPGAGAGSNFVYSTITAADISYTGNPLAAATSLSIDIGDVVNQGLGDPTTDDLVIVYRARVLNTVFAQADNTPLLNNASFSYDTATGVSVQADNVTVNLLQPDLLVSKSALPANGDTVIDAGEIIEYTVEVENTGAAPAYDLVLEDIIPLGLRNGALTITVDSVELLLGGALAVVNPSYNATTGVATWDFDTGVADSHTIPAGDTLRVVYRVQADPGLGAGLTMTNAATATLYYSFDDDDVPANGVANGREIYGPSNTDTVTLTTDNPNPPLQIAPAPFPATAIIGEPFTYRIRIPDIGQTTALHDVRILEDLSVSTGDPVALNYVSSTRISGSQPWGLENAGTPVAVELQDLAAGVGIEVPATETIEIDMQVVLLDDATNVAGNSFNNTVSYTFNGVDDDNGTVASGGNNTSANIRILEPLDLVVSHTGPAAAPIPLTFGSVETFTIDVENSTATNANASDAHDLTLTAVFDESADGGICDVAPANFNAEIQNGGGGTVRLLTENTDYVTSFSGAPACTLTITMQSNSARIEPDNHLVVTYEATLDIDGVDGTLFNSTVTASEWFSADNTAANVAIGEIRRYTNDSPDEVDVLQLEVLAPVLEIDKEVFNVTSNTAAPAGPTIVNLQAEAGDTLRYTITVRNVGRAGITSFQVTDEPDALTTPPGLFDPGTMSNVIVTAGLPSGPSIDATNPAAGANGAGILDIQNLSLDALGGGVDTLTITFEIDIAPVAVNASVIMNQAFLVTPAFTPIPSDDPNKVGNANTTDTDIGTSPAFITEKTSQDLTGNPNVLRNGDTLRYTLRVQNVGAENSINTVLRDQIPAHTSYVANSTTLNGVAVSDTARGNSRLQAGLRINAPEDTTPGFMRADPAGTTNIATVTFDVVVANNVINGTAISNQAFVSGTGSAGDPYPDQPSDDPDTALVNDPTIDVVGNLPILKMQKTVDFSPGGDINDDGIVDPGEGLRYTFVITNTGSAQATGSLLTDNVPVNSAYVANSLNVNGVASIDAVPGVSPLIAGINISSTASPSFNQVGVVQSGQQAVVTMDVTVTGVAGQLITNQATLDSNELPRKLSDADGNDENGDQQTVVVIGNAQQLSITKEVNVVGGGVATAGGRLEYIVTVRNIGSQDATGVVISDTLVPELNLVNNSVTLNGASDGVTILGANITADYSSEYGDLEAGEFATLRFVATIDSAQTTGTTINNTADVTWNTTQTANDSASVDIGATPGTATVRGIVWWDNDFSGTVDDGEDRFADWRVDIFLQGQRIDTVRTNDNGVFRVNGMIPSAASGAEYRLRYRAPGAGSTTAALGVTQSAFTDGPQLISDIFVGAGSYNRNFDLPLTPNGIVYDSVVRTAVEGASLRMINQTRSNQPVPAGCYTDPNQQTQVTQALGFYKFDLNFSDPSRCRAGDEYVIEITPPADGYIGTTSVIIPPVRPVTRNPLDVISCPGAGSGDDRIPATTQHCETSASNLQPPSTVSARTAGTSYYLKFLFNGAGFTDQVYNNHIPVDPELDAAVAITKVAGLLNVTRSQLVPYTITVSNSIGAPLQDLNVVDDYPLGFKYVAGSTRIDGVAVEPVIDGNTMTWENLSLNTEQTITIKMLLVVGAGVSEGEYVNTARVVNSRNNDQVSGVATATVRVIPDPTFDCTDIIGKVYEDVNLNGYADDGEKGLAGVQVATARGLRVTTDSHGRFHITCAVVPNEVRGSNFIMKVDERSLPSGYRMTTENPRVKRATRGKMLKFNFGATIHRVVRLDLADGVFEKGSTELRPQWKSRIEFLVTELQKDPSILRLAYLGENETRAEVDDRLDAIENLVAERWKQIDCCYKLTIEKEVFWRKGKPGGDQEFDQ